MISIVIFSGCLALAINIDLLMDNIKQKRYAITPINVMGILCSLAAVIWGVGGSI